jgi:hypothetical protein
LPAISASEERRAAPCAAEEAAAVDGAYEVTAPPAQLKASEFYTKYLDAHGYPVLEKPDEKPGKTRRKNQRKNQTGKTRQALLEKPDRHY